MSHRRATAPPAPAAERSFTLVETIVSVAVVGVMFVAALNTVGAARMRQHKMSRGCVGRHLAQLLMAEILQQAYAEPVDAPVFGAEPSEATGCRAIYDDVDDYRGWAASPPENKDGTPVGDLSGWQRDVYVKYTSPDDFSLVVGIDTGVKRISVEVSCNGLPVATLLAVRTRNAQGEPSD